MPVTIPHARGVAAELTVAKYLVDRGYHVYLPFSRQGPADILAVDPESEQIILIDAKSAKYIRSRAKTDEQRKLGVHIVTVDLDTGGVKLPPKLRKILRCKLY